MEVIPFSPQAMGIIAHTACDAKLLERLRLALTAGDPACRLTTMLELLERHERTETEAA